MLPALQGAHSIQTKMYVFIVSHRTPDAKVIAPYSADRETKAEGSLCLPKAQMELNCRLLT